MKDETFNEFKDKLEKFTPLLPDAVTEYFIEKAGIECCDDNVKKYVSLLAQKFITDIATSAMQHRKIHQKGASKDKRMPKEKKNALQIADIEKALAEYGIDISRPFYFL
ncbi:transcription initiation factor TFIID subunit [Tubulinosema ratisbonensis]|uniref:Transcription initiation factor TFIID subunit n=1 Tax=Tubulinosema ratisbonensis TaxID=291195 RepID=A0A437AJ75_9MICR|nr:transcription initiation factor TFIID subunit [Tubulinosema ratisbonensis]RVD91116.1 transcription initiation factor TFIID subunit [Tubulinosema ratisbonensis]